MSVVVQTDPFDSWPAERLETEITLVAAHLAAAECRWLQMVGAFDRREVWASWGCASAAHWLNWRCGLAMGAARERVRVARRMAECPAVTAAFAEGELSYSKVRAITRVATAANEATLVDLARCMTASHLERTVRCYKRVNDEADRDEDTPGDPEEQYQDRYLMSWWNDDGTLSIKAKLPPAEGEMVLAALRRAADALYRRSRAGGDTGGPDDVPAGTPGGDTGGPDDVPAGTPGGDTDTSTDNDVPAGTPYDTTGGPDDVPAGTPSDGSGNDRRCPSQDWTDTGGPDDVPAGTWAGADVADEAPRPWDKWAARQADALVAMAETVVADGLRPGSGPNRHTLVIHTNATDWAATTDDEVGGHLDGGPPLPIETVRRLMCDASVMFALDGPDGKVINVSPRAPSVPTALARAIKLRDGACVFPGCTRQAFVDIHHLHHRIDGGENSRANLACLCRVHHRMVHEGGFTMSATATGQFLFRRPDGTALTTSPTRVDAGDDALRDVNAAHGVVPTDSTSVPDWDGRHPNYAMIIDLLLAVDGRLDYDARGSNN